MAEGYAILSMDTEVGKNARDAIIKFQLRLARQNHDRDGGSEDLGQRRKVEDGFHLHLVLMRQQRSESEGTFENHVGAGTHDHRGSGKDAALDGVIERLLYLTP